VEIRYTHVEFRHCLATNLSGTAFLAANLSGTAFLAVAYERVFVTITHLLFNGGSRIGSNRPSP
jgi:hypothetical protein